MRHFIIFFLAIFIYSCSSTLKTNTLRDVDITTNSNNKPRSFGSSKNDDDIRAAYAEYLRHASKNDISRLDALQRLAQLEFDLSEKLDKNRGKQTDKTQDIEDKIYNETLDRSIELLKTSLRDYPNSKKNDKTLYQLAKAYDQRGEYENSISTLEKLAIKFPNSGYYVECEFRLGEHAFSMKNYSKAEDLYTNVIVSRKNGEYLENALYKRGWARYKQEYYQDAIEDFLAVIDLHDFSPYSTLKSSQKSQFDEYFRAIGLSFSYLGGAETLNTYFKKHPDFKFIYHAYAHVSDIYLKQQRYSDAVDTLTSFISNHPNSAHVPLASTKILDIWKNAGFINKLIPALNEYYTLYHPASRYWSNHNASEPIYNAVTTSIRNYTVIAATYYHKQFDATHKQSSFSNAKEWYDRYLKYYKAYSRKDNINLLYAELLSAHHDSDEALYHYEQAAYDSGIILNKDAAYSTILISNQLYANTNDPASKAQYLDKLIKYSLMYAQLYPGDEQSMNVLTRASQAAYHAGQYGKTVKLTELYAGKAFATDTYNINIIKANSYFKLKQYEDAESTYRSVLHQYHLDTKTKSELTENLAISIYNQAKHAESAGEVSTALDNYSRISAAAPTSSIASTGLYDAIALCMRNKLWDDAIKYIKLFQATYPNNRLSHDVSKKLSVAYLNSHQDLAAANELVKIARTDNDTTYKTAALWKAGELYESKKDWISAIKSFKEYALTYRRPYSQYIESMHKLTSLYSQVNDSNQVNHWQKAILDADKRTPAELKTDRTNFICSQTALKLAYKQNSIFATIKLTIPLKRSLDNKKYYMQRAVNLYGRASSYGIPSVATEATYSIAEIYRAFSKSLLTSERPKNLSKAELDQYNILLEDKSFPFEDKAIEFFATNLHHVKDGIYDDWIQKSYAKLKELYPARYNRDVKLEPYINVLH